MGTRSFIAMVDEGKLHVIYCHWDGQLEHNGKILATHYRDPKKVKRLIALGDLSSLQKELGEADSTRLLPEDYVQTPNVRDMVKRGEQPRKHSWDTPVQFWTVAYHRDRGDDWGRCKPAVCSAMFPQLIWQQIEDTGHFYLYVGERWFHISSAMRMITDLYSMQSTTYGHTGELDILKFIEDVKETV